jgi:beta-phosphoglucomutase-like phosphatase (HAD superfamily)
MAQVGAKPQESIAIEDSRTGVAAAVAAKIYTFGFTGFSQNSAELRKILITTGASQIFNDWRELFELLR